MPRVATHVAKALVAGTFPCWAVLVLAGAATAQPPHPHQIRQPVAISTRPDLGQRLQPATFAQPAATPARLAEAGPFSAPATVEQLVQYALAHNPEIQAACHLARALAERVPQVAALPDPMFFTEVMFMEEMQPVTVGLAQKFPWFGKRTLRSEEAHYDAMAAYARVVTSQLEVTEEVKKAYYDLYYAERATEETRRIEQLLDDLIEVTEHRYRTGVGDTGLQDVLQVRNELSKLQMSLVELEQSGRQARARLLQSLHLPQTTLLETERTIDRVRVAHRAETLMALVQRWQPELEVRRREMARDRTAIAVAQREYWPDVTMAVMGSELGSTRPGVMGRDALMLGAEVNLPIYRSRLDAAVREAEYQAAATARRYAATQDRFQADVQSLHAQFAEHDRILGILQEQIVPRSAEAFELVTEAYRAGRADFQQLLDTYRTLLQYRIDLYRREALRQKTVAALERAVGGAITTPSE